MIDVLVLACLGFILYRWICRVQFKQWLETNRITPDQLGAMMRSDTPPVIYDARPQEVRRKEPYRIKGAIALDLDLPDRVDQMLSEHEVVVYCVCPNEATAQSIARRLHAKGFRNVRPLKGGLDAWEKHGYPVEDIPPESKPVAHEHDDIDGIDAIRSRSARRRRSDGELRCDAERGGASSDIECACRVVTVLDHPDCRQTCPREYPLQQSFAFDARHRDDAFEPLSEAG